MRRPLSRATVLRLAALACLAAAGAQACSSFVVSCGDGAVVGARTLDFPGSLDTPLVTHIGFWPKTKVYTGTPLAAAGPAPQLSFQYDFVYAGLQSSPSMQPMVLDAMNAAGLGLAVNWQSNVSFHHRYDSKQEGQAMAITDMPYYVLGKLGSVQEVREFLSTAPQLTTDLQDPTLSSALAAVFDDPDVPKAEDDGTLYLPVHYHFMDASGDSVLLQATLSGAYALYNTTAVTNEPEWPLMEAWREEYLTWQGLAEVPGIAGQVQPLLNPLVIPFNHQYDSTETGYFGSLSRYMRLYLQLQDCEQFQWPDGTWSPGHANASTTPPPASFRALKRAENYMAAQIVPMSQLAGPAELQAEIGTYATQTMFLRDYTELVYYYRTHQNNQWSSIDLRKLEGVTEPRAFPIGLTSAPFSTDVTAGLQ